MAVWSIRSNSTDYAYLEFTEEQHYHLLSEIRGVPSRTQWQPLRVTVAASDLPLSNSPYLAPGTLVLDEHALAVLQPYLGHYGEILSLVCEIRPFIVFNVTTVVDCLDHNLSTFDRFKDGGIKRIRQYAFKANCIRDRAIFRIHEFNSVSIFVTDPIKQAIERNALTGILFHKVWQEAG